jgi:hypothetical protein
MTPEQYQETRQLTPEEQAQLREAEAELATDIKQAGEAAKNKAHSISPDLLGILQETERTQFVKGLVEVQISQDLFAQDARLARVFALSGAFSDIKGTPQQAIAMAMTKIRLGRSWGLSEADSMQFIYFTNGKPAVMNELIAAKLYEAGLEWDIRWHQAAGKCTGCTLYPKVRKPTGDYYYLMEADPAEPAKQRKVEVSFTKADADTAMIWEKGKQMPLSSKWNFQSWAQDMYYWRCVARLKRRYRPNVLSGALTQFEAEEITPGAGSFPDRIIASTKPPDDDPRWLQTGSAAAAEAAAAKKIAELEQQRGQEAAVAAGAQGPDLSGLGQQMSNPLARPPEAAVAESASGAAAPRRIAFGKKPEEANGPLFTGGHGK